MPLLSIILLFTLVVLSPPAASATPRVVASIKPVHGLVSNLMQGVAEPALLMQSSQSPHHYSIKPSERRLLVQADLVFWIGPGMESFMPRLLESLDQKTRAVSLIATTGLVLLPLRAADAHAHAEHGRHHDPHIWLHTHNLAIMADAITRQLIQTDPQHRAAYENNNHTFKQRLNMLRAQLHQQLDNLHSPFLTYHDGYQYFEHEFGLNHAGFISTGSEIQSGAGYIRQLKKRIQQKNIQCVFYDAPVKPPLLNSLLADSHARAVALDATGMTLPAGADNLFQVMQSLGEKFSGCLLDEP